MVKKLLHPIKSKKGISEMISYAMLIIIAIGLSAGVFTFLKSYIPKYQTPECPKNINIAVRNIKCAPSEISFEVVNKGLFSVDALFIRFNPPNKTIESLVPSDGYTSLKSPLVPGNITNISKSLGPKAEPTSGYTLKIQPAVFKEDGNLAACEGIITQKVTCSLF